MIEVSFSPTEIGNLELRSFPPSLNLRPADGAKAFDKAIPSMEEGFANFTGGKDGKALKAGMQNQVWEYPF